MNLRGEKEKAEIFYSKSGSPKWGSIDTSLEAVSRTYGREFGKIWEVSV